MSYLRGQGGVLDDIQSILGKARGAVQTGKQIVQGAAPYVDVAKDIVTDPALPTVASLVRELRAITVRESAGRPSGPEPGIGLRHAVPPLTLYVQYRQHPWIVRGALAALVYGIYRVGYSRGRRRSK